METTYIFKRVERKYLLDEVTKKRLLHRMQGKLLLDEYGKSTIFSLYLDTPSGTSERICVIAACTPPS